MEGDIQTLVIMFDLVIYHGLKLFFHLTHHPDLNQIRIQDSQGYTLVGHIFLAREVHRIWGDGSIAKEAKSETRSRSETIN